MRLQGSYCKAGIYCKVTAFLKTPHNHTVEKTEEEEEEGELGAADKPQGCREEHSEELYGLAKFWSLHKLFF